MPSHTEEERAKKPKGKSFERLGVPTPQEAKAMIERAKKSGEFDEWSAAKKRLMGMIAGGKLPTRLKKAS